MRSRSFAPIQCAHGRFHRLADPARRNHVRGRHFRLGIRIGADRDRTADRLAAGREPRCGADGRAQPVRDLKSSMGSNFQAGPLADGNRVRIVVATSVMLTFISYWRAAAIVLNDLASSAFYAGGIAEQAIGKSAPWLILAVMLFSLTVRAVYIESCSMFVRGGVYRVVKEALGGKLAKLSVSALMFDYILTGPISGVSAGQYIAGLIRELIAAGASDPR